MVIKIKNKIIKEEYNNQRIIIIKEEYNNTFICDPWVP